MTPNAERDMIARIWFAVFIGCFMILVMIVVNIVAAAMAEARDNGQFAGSPNKEWFEGLKSGKGPCCSGADGTALQDIDWESRDGHYRVRIESKWWTVPDEAVITEPNLIGRTMVWPVYHRSGLDVEQIDIRCFMVGPLS